jgi:hypothetical protein
MSFTLEKIYSEMETLGIIRISVLLLYLPCQTSKNKEKIDRGIFSKRAKNYISF